MFEQFHREYRKWVAEGYIKEDYVSSEQGSFVLSELLDALTKQNMEATQMELLRKIYFVMASERISKRDDALPTQYFKIAQSLSAGEVLVLFATHQVLVEALPELRLDMSKWMATRWIKAIAPICGFPHAELIELHEEGLVSKRLLTMRANPESRTFRLTKYGNLTGLGYGFCEFARQYDLISEQMKK